MKKIIIITGASSGIGREFSKQLYGKFKNSSKEVYEFWLFARSEDSLQKTKECMPDTEFVRTKIFPQDLTGTEGSKKFNEILKNEYEKEEFSIKILINNAGFGTYGPFADTETEREMDMIELNCTALTGICGYSLFYLAEGSIIINVSSLAAFMPLGNFAVYAATKAFVLSFSVALAAELKDKGITVTALCPGSVSTNFSDVASNGARKEVLHGKPPEKVVAHCIKKAFRGKKIILWSAKWKFTSFLSRLAGRYTVARFTYKFHKRPYAHK